MVALNFQRTFVPLIRAGRKRQTIRSERKNPIQSGEVLHLYTGQRSPDCMLIGRTVCTLVEPIRMVLRPTEWPNRCSVETPSLSEFWQPEALDAFALSDGFADWAGLQAFFLDYHPDEATFTGTRICWDALLQVEALEQVAADG